MEFQTPLVPATLLRRYKRFLADVELGSGEIVTAHCPNPGAMTGLAAPGMQVWLEPNDDPKKKLKYGWRLLRLDTGAWVGIDTGVPNRVVGEALAKKAIPELNAYETVRPEVKYGARSRVDFLLSSSTSTSTSTSTAADCYVEVKNVHLRRSGAWAEFPDSVTARGAKHLNELANVVERGARAVMFYLVTRDDCDAMRLAADIDAVYAAAYDAATARGVETLVYGTRISQFGVELGERMRFSADHARGDA